MNSPIATTIEPHIQDLGGFEARRLLPSERLTTVGPFIFFDHLGPALFPPGKGVDVRPHPHINLATVTYLFEGALMHRDSLGVVQEIRPGEVNWMTAGRGIVHSERSPERERSSDARLHGIQTWVALPEDAEETEPSFYHYSADDIPRWEGNGATVVPIVGEVNGLVSPVKTFSPILYLDLQLSPNSSFTLTASHSERAIYSATSGLSVDGRSLEQHRLAVLEFDGPIEISSSSGGRCMVIGGEPLGTRYKWWNFVSSRQERIEQAKLDWKQKRFASVPDEVEFIPLPDS